MPPAIVSLTRSVHVPSTISSPEKPESAADADLYVRLGSAPTTSTWDCRPYADGSAESCEVTAAEGQAVHVMVRGYATSSNFELLGFPL